ncbi:16S rRNA (cytidine(1402)-2'-O)-methyltransferase [Actinomadura oligospora]|uniref:16S rRNA (cytidine(1402)-2'-O)-methyltransferase n=1 Tax=Actinomadura oligospora TaxID=111804 RepID=UPI00047D8AA0|nr:16S rRNA (cytidine(1402)-2'-O)-methyltransferase [Actinomadura oligospora]
MTTEALTNTGTLLLAAAPIGRPEDASRRLLTALADVPVVAAEDTRRLRRLAADLGVEITGRVLAHHEHNERASVDGLIAELLAGRDVLVITDAGMPGVSDPGYRLVRAAVAEGVPVTVLPGPSAVTTALVVSGLPTDRFCFEGFPPRKQGERARRLASLSHEQRTMVFFESPRRLADSLAAMAEAFGADRPAAVCRELTKTYEEVRRGTLADLTRWAEDGVLGEITVVVGGAPEHAGLTEPADLAAAVAARTEATGVTRKEAIAEIAKENGVPKRVVYDAVVDSTR